MIVELWRAFKAIIKEEYSSTPVKPVSNVRPCIRRIKETQKAWHDLQDIAPIGSDLETFRDRNGTEIFITNILFSAVTKATQGDDAAVEDILDTVEIFINSYIDRFITGNASYDPVI